MQSHGRWSAYLRYVFLERLADSASVSASAAHVNKSVRSAYRLRESDPEFAKAWDEALNIALDDLEQVLVQRAKNGVTQPHVVRGKEVGMTTTYSDALAMFILRAKRPEVYGQARGTKAAKDTLRKGQEDPLGQLEAKLQAMGERLEGKKEG